MEMNGKRILLGVSGSIAAYKAAVLTRWLCGAGAEVRVAMTRAATAFVTPLTFQALSGNRVHGLRRVANAHHRTGHAQRRIVCCTRAHSELAGKLAAHLACAQSRRRPRNLQRRRPWVAHITTTGQRHGQ